MRALRLHLKKHPKTHLIFDFDETLFKLLLPWELWMQYVEEKLARIDQNLMKEYKENRLAWPEMQNQYIHRYKDVAKKIIITGNTEFETKHFQGVEVNKELVQFINDATTYVFSLWSSNTKPIIEKVLHEHHLHHIFSHVITRTDLLYLKPHHEGFSLIHDGKTPKEDYLLVGNSQTDKAAAKSAGIDFFLVDYFK